MAIPNKSTADEGGRVTVSFSDSIRLVKDQIQWTPQGVSLLTKWYFDVGTEVEFAFDYQGERHCCTGVIVACHPLRQPRGYFETVLYFVETPCPKLQQAACACRLARDGEYPRDKTQFTIDNQALEMVASDEDWHEVTRTRSSVRVRSARRGDVRD